MKRWQRVFLGIWVVLNICGALFAGFILYMATWLHYLPMHTSSSAYEPVPAPADTIMWDIVNVVVPALAIISIAGGVIYFFNYYIFSAFSSQWRKRLCLCLALIWCLILLFGLAYSSYAYFQKHASFFY